MADAAGSRYKRGTTIEKNHCPMPMHAETIGVDLQVGLLRTSGCGTAASTKTLSRLPTFL
jgi:hypothetical protein